MKQNLETLGALEAAVHPGAQRLTGMPHAVGVNDRIGDLAVEIADLRRQIVMLQLELDRERTKLNQFISSIDNDLTRTVFRLRFLRCLTWKEVATVIGGGNTEQTVKKICYRFLNTMKTCPAVSRRVP